MKLLFGIPLVVFGWYKYFSTDSSSMMLLSLVVIASTVVFLMVRSDYRKAAAANNIVAAAATFGVLDGDQRARIHDHAIQIIKRSWRGGREPQFATDAARFGWYALAMAELGIEPVCILPSWNFVRNPFIAIAVSDSNIDTALHTARKQGFDVELSRTLDIEKYISR